jgi:exopolysaccharide production protein ExoZ
MDQLPDVGGDRFGQRQATMAGAQPHKLLWIEVGRGIAALGVVASHLGKVSPAPTSLKCLGDWGVQFFFVLSGFIIAYVHSRDFDDPKKLGIYVSRRLSRIFPVFWLVLPIAIVLLELKPAPYRPTIPLIRLATDALLLPNGYPPLLDPAWTLRHEMIFYGIFALALINRRIAVSAFALWGAALFWSALVLGDFPRSAITLPGILLLPVNLFFFAGLALCWATKAGKAGMFAIAAIAVACVFAALGKVMPDMASRANFLSSVALSGGIVGALVSTSLRGIRVPRMLAGLGAISYVLYLTHYPLFWALHSADRLAGHPLAAVPGAAVIVPLAASVGSAALVYIWFDRPVMRWLKSRAATRPAAYSPSPSPLHPAPSPLS